MTHFHLMILWPTCHIISLPVLDKTRPFAKFQQSKTTSQFVILLSFILFAASFPLLLWTCFANGCPTQCLWHLVCYICKHLTTFSETKTKKHIVVGQLTKWRNEETMCFQSYLLSVSATVLLRECIQCSWRKLFVQTSINRNKAANRSLPASNKWDSSAHMQINFLTQ